VKKLAVSVLLALCVAVGEVRAADSAADSDTSPAAVEAAEPKTGATAAPEEKVPPGPEIAAVPTAPAREVMPAGGASPTPAERAEPQEKRPWWAPWRPDRSQEEAAKAAAGQAAAGAAVAAVPTAAAPGVIPRPGSEEDRAAAADARAREKNGKLAATLDAFCAKWMGFLSVRERDNQNAIKWQTTPGGVEGKYVGYSDTFKCFLKDIAKKETPVATIRYLEYLYEKDGASKAEAESSEPKVVESTEVTEIFRYSKGKWVY
jgi:hypothetical protein